MNSVILSGNVGIIMLYLAATLCCFGNAGAAMDAIRETVTGGPNYPKATIHALLSIAGALAMAAFK